MCCEFELQLRILSSQWLCGDVRITGSSEEKDAVDCGELSLGYLGLVMEFLKQLVRCYVVLGLIAAVVSPVGFDALFQLMCQVLCFE